uniref:Uncharacterized protein n=1 Tax=Anguilla anguilla TaxID=7936 RepID=A0A0E9Q843_ANGAN
MEDKVIFLHRSWWLANTGYFRCITVMTVFSIARNSRAALKFKQVEMKSELTSLLS